MRRLVVCSDPRITCNGPEDCAPGRVCCALLGLVREQDRIECSAGCGAVATVCHTDRDCPMGAVCYADHDYFEGEEREGVEPSEPCGPLI